MRPRLILFPLAAATFGGCLHVKMDPVQVNVVADVNLKVDREVASLLSDIYGNSSTVKVPNPPAK